LVSIGSMEPSDQRLRSETMKHPDVWFPVEPDAVLD
jgi:hypothetical protein